MSEIVRNVHEKILSWNDTEFADPAAIERTNAMRVLTLPRSLQTPLAALLPAKRLNPSNFSHVLTAFRWHVAPRSLPDNAAASQPTFLWSLLPQFAFDPVAPTNMIS
jgi:hypothetical protein